MTNATHPKRMSYELSERINNILGKAFNDYLFLFKRFS